MESRPGGGAATGWSQRLKSESPTWLLLITDGRCHPGSDETTFSFHCVFFRRLRGENSNRAPRFVWSRALRSCFALFAPASLSCHISCLPDIFTPAALRLSSCLSFPACCCITARGVARTHSVSAAARCSALTEARPGALWRPQNDIALKFSIKVDDLPDILGLEV